MLSFHVSPFYSDSNKIKKDSSLILQAQLNEYFWNSAYYYLNTHDTLELNCVGGLTQVDTNQDLGWLVYMLFHKQPSAINVYQEIQEKKTGCWGVIEKNATENCV